MRELLLDTGLLVAFLIAASATTSAALTFFKTFRSRLLTTEPVLTEAVYLLGPHFYNQKPVLDFILMGGSELIPLSPALLKRTAQLMAKYADVPMDFADASLVALAEERGITEMVTLDKKDFTVYRTTGRKGFTVLPD